jgi:hypothetical protein
MSYLDLQQIIPSNSLVVHFMVGIICITTALILDESKAALLSAEEDHKVDWKVIQSAAGGSRSWNIASDEASVMLELVGKVTSSCAMSEA